MRKLLPLIGAITLTSLLAVSSYVQADISIPLPSSTPAVVSQVPNHIQQYLQIDGTVGKNSCWHVAPTDAFAGSCNTAGQPTPGPGGTLADMQALHKYVDYVETNSGGGEEFFAAGGMRTSLYRDAALVHIGATGFYGLGTSSSIALVGGETPQSPAPGVTPTAVLNPLWADCLVSAGSVPTYVFLQSKRYGNPLYALNNEGNNSCSAYNGGTALNGGAAFGDVNNAAIAYWARSIEILTHKILPGLGGYGGAGSQKSSSNGMSLIRWDDEDYPAHRYTNAPVCANGPFGYSSATGTPPPSCAAAGGTASTQSDNAYFMPYAGSSIADDMNPNWVEGTRNLFRMPARFGMQSIYNDAYDPTQLKYIMVPDRANVMAVMCEGCIGRNGANLWNLNAWENHVNTEIVANDWGVKFLMKTPGINSVADDVYVTASEWLGETMMPQGLIEMGQGYGSTNSGTQISPLSWLVPTQPISDPANLRFDPYAINYNKNVAPTNYGVATLQKSGGAYVREFAHCYVGVTLTPRDLGACAAVSFPVAGTFPTLTGTYGYSWSYTGAGVITDTQFNGGDNGTLTNTTTIPAAGTSEAVGAAFILTANN